jgi:ribosomal-protein-alanine N-acetyltransferase
MLMVRPRLRVGQGGKAGRQNFFSGAGTAGLWKSGTARAEGACRVNLRPSDRCFSRVGPPFFGRNPLSARGRYNGAVAFVIRDFKPEDFETLWRIDQACFPPGISYSRPELKAYIRHRGSFTLIASDTAADEVQGFIVAHNGPTGHVVTIDVMEPARRSGLGSLLLGAAEARLRAGGSRAVGLETAVDNVSALSFYKRHGYSVIRTWPRYYSNGVDALVLKKELK